MKSLDEYLQYEQPTKYIVESTDYNEKYDTPVLTAGQSFILGYTKETSGIFPKDKLPVIIFDDFTTSMKYVDFPFKVKSSAMKILHPKDNANIKYFYYLMQSIVFDSSTHKRYWISEYSKILIEEKSCDEQDKIVYTLDTISKAINNRKSQLDDLNEVLEQEFVKIYESNYPMTTLNTLVDVRDGTHDSPIGLQQSDYILLTSKNITNKGINYENVKYISKEDFDEINKRSKVDVNDILMPMIGTIGNPIIVKEVNNYAIKNMALFKKSNKVLPNFLLYFLRSKWFLSYVQQNNRGATQKFVSLTDIRNTPFKQIPIVEQEKFESIVKKVNTMRDNIILDITDMETLYDKKIHEYFD